VHFFSLDFDDMLDGRKENKEKVKHEYQYISFYLIEEKEERKEREKLIYRNKI